MGTCRASSGDDVFRLFSPFPSSIPLLTVFCYCTYSAYAILPLQLESIRSATSPMEPLKPLYTITAHKLYHPDTKVDSNPRVVSPMSFLSMKVALVEDITRT